MISDILKPKADKCVSPVCTERIGTNLGEQYRLNFGMRTTYIQGAAIIHTQCEKGHWTTIKLTAALASG